LEKILGVQTTAYPGWIDRFGLMDSGLLKQFKASGTGHGWFGGESSGGIDFSTFKRRF